MHPTLKRKLAIGTTVLAAAAFAGGAYAAGSSGTSPRQTFLNDVANRLHVSPAQLNSALSGAFNDRLDAAVKAGQLTQTQANALKQRIARRGVPPVGFGGRGVLAHRGGRFFLGRGPGGPGGLGGPGGPGGPGAPGGPGHGGKLEAAATYLGLTETQLFDQLRSGKSLANIANAHHKSVSGLKDALSTAIKARLDEAVKAKWLTSTQEQKILSRLPARLEEIVNRTGFGPRMFRGRRMPGGFAGQLPPGGPGGPGIPGGPPPGVPGP